MAASGATVRKRNREWGEEKPMRPSFEPLSFRRGPAMKNRYMVAPLTNEASNADGTLSDEEYRFLRMRAQGGFGAVMTCGAHVTPGGQSFKGQLGVCSDAHVPGLTRLAAGLKAAGSVAILQLFHGGRIASREFTGQQPVFPSDDPHFGARALTTGEVEQLIEDFIVAGVRAEKAGFDGAELHAAHSYLPCAFLSPVLNRRTDHYGGTPENRARFVREIVTGLRERCGPDFNIGLRLSAEGFDLDLADSVALAQAVMTEGAIDYLDMSLWDVFKDPEDERFRGQSLLSCFTELDRGAVRLGVAGKIRSARAVEACLAGGADFALIGRGAIIHHDFPERSRADLDYEARLPVSRKQLEAEGVSPAFLNYLDGFQGFLAPEDAAPERERVYIP